MSLKILGAVPLSIRGRLDVGENGRAMISSPAAVRLNIIDGYEDAIDQVGNLLPSR